MLRKRDEKLIRKELDKEAKTEIEFLDSIIEVLEMRGINSKRKTKIISNIVNY